MSTNVSFENVLKYVQYDDLRGLWWVVKRPMEYGLLTNNSESYKGKIDLFCAILEWLLKENKVRLAKSGIFLEGTPKELANRFRKAFPPTEKEMEEKDAYWVFLDQCPGGSVWYTDTDDGLQTSPTGDGRYYYWT